MKKHWFSLTILAIGLSFSGVNAHAEAGAIDYEHNWIFPSTLAGLTFKSFDRYEDTERGYSVYYERAPAYQAEIQIYTMGGDVPDGYNSPGIKKVLESAEYTLKVMERQEMIFDIKRRSQTIVPPKGAVQFASEVYEYKKGDSENPRKATKHMLASYATGLEGQYIKVMITCDLAEQQRAPLVAQKMLADLTQITQTQPDSKTLALESIRLFKADPNSTTGRTAASYIMNFAKMTETLDISIYPHLFPWQEDNSNEENAPLLTASYFAGVVEYMLNNDKTEDGVFEGFLCILDTYQTLRNKEQIGRINTLEQWLKAKNKRALFDKMLEE